MSGVIYVVNASAGEYEDRREWSVAAYLDEPTAAEHARLAQEENDRISAWFSEGDNHEARYDNGRCPLNAYDPNHKDEWHIGEARYGVETIPVLAAVPSVTLATLPATEEA